MNIPRGYSMQLRNFINAGLIKRRDLSSQVYQTAVERVAQFAADPAHTPEEVAQFEKLIYMYTEAQLLQFVPFWQAAPFREHAEQIKRIPF